MKKNILTSILPVLVISILLVSVKSFSMANETVEGQGTFVNEDGSRSEFSFNARRNPNGKVTGQGILRNPSYKKSNGQIEQIKIDISCLKVIGNLAVIGGMTKRKNNQTETEAIYFAVEDNGDAGADKIFRGFFFDDDPITKGDPQVCQSFEPTVLVLEPIADGNIQVQTGKQ
jgi:hypothetical protein